MFKLLKHLLEEETDYVTKKRASGEFVIRVSTIVLILITVLYIVSPYDLFPEGSVKSLTAYVDDLILLIFTAYWTYKDLGGEVSIENGRVQLSGVSRKEDTDRQDSVPSTDRPSNEDIHDARDKHSVSSNINADKTIDSVPLDSYNASSVSDNDDAHTSDKSDFIVYNFEDSDEVTDEDSDELRL